jgi:hypothetical protein
VTALAPLTEAALGDERALRVAQLVDAGAVKQRSVEVGHVWVGGPRRLGRQSALAAGDLHGQDDRRQPSKVIAAVLHEHAERSAHAPPALRDGQVEEAAGVLEFLQTCIPQGGSEDVAYRLIRPDGTVGDRGLECRRSHRLSIAQLIDDRPLRGALGLEVEDATAGLAGVAAVSRARMTDAMSTVTASATDGAAGMVERGWILVPTLRLRPLAHSSFPPYPWPPERCWCADDHKTRNWYTMDPSDCEDCRRRVLKNERGDFFNPTANPTDERLEDVSDCKTSFQNIKDYFAAELKRCSRCGAVWLLGYYEDFDDVPITSEWGKRTWIWRPLTSEQMAAIEAARDRWALDINTFAT